MACIDSTDGPVRGTGTSSFELGYWRFSWVRRVTASSVPAVHHLSEPTGKASEYGRREIHAGRNSGWNSVVTNNDRKTRRNVRGTGRNRRLGLCHVTTTFGDNYWESSGEICTPIWCMILCPSLLTCSLIGSAVLHVQCHIHPIRYISPPHSP